MSTQYLCPLCNSPSQFVFEKYGYPIQDCETCSHRFAGIDLSVQHVNHVYGDDYFTGGGAGYSDYMAEASLLTQHGEYYGKLVNKFMQPGTVLDVGAAAGFILQGLHNTGWTGDGVEPNETMVKYGRETLGLNLFASSFEDYSPTNTYDLVTMIQVVAHFYDFNRAMEIARDMLRPDGYLMIETWDVASLPARLLGESWHEYSPPSVVHWFSEATLTAQLEQHGYRFVNSGKPAKYIKSGHIQSLLGYKLSSSTFGKLLVPPMNLIPDNITLPYPTFDLFWALYQKV